MTPVLHSSRELDVEAVRGRSSDCLVNNYSLEIRTGSKFKSISKAVVLNCIEDKYHA